MSTNHDISTNVEIIKQEESSGIEDIVVNETTPTPNDDAPIIKNELSSPGENDGHDQEPTRDCEMKDSSNDKVTPQDVAVALTAASNEPGAAAAAASAAVKNTDDHVAVDRSTWDHSHRRVIVDGVFRYDDAKTCRKIMDKWAADIKSKQQQQGQGGGAPLLLLEVEKVRKPPKEHFMVVTVKEESMVQLLIDYINVNGIENKKGKKLFARLATDNDDRDDRKKRQRDDTNGDADSNTNHRNHKRQNIDQTARDARRPVTEDEIRDKITPLWRLSPQEQLDTKQKDMAKKCAMKLIQELKARFRLLEKEAKRDRTPLYNWISRIRCIDVEPVISAPTPLRNKSEFNFGYRYIYDDSVQAPEKDTTCPSIEEKTDKAAVSDTSPETAAAVRRVPAVGFMATGWAGGVSKPHCCANIPPEVCSIVDVVDEFLLTSPLPPYDSKSHKGFWRTLTVRTSRRTAECMIIIMHAPVSGGVGDASDFSQQDVDQDKTRLVSVLTQASFAVPDLADQAPLKVTSVFFQSFDGVSSPSPDHPVQHVYGNTWLQERLGECMFQISPGAFFQVNTQGAEILYQLVVDKVREVSKDPNDTLLFDVCCGTGTIGLTCMKAGVVGKVVGIDISEPAIADAKRNAQLNGFGDNTTDGQGDSSSSCTRFVAARAEHVMMKEIGRAKNSKTNKFVAVVDPARDGLHTDVVKALRGNERIERIVYVSCNPTGSLIKDAALLCAPPTKRYGGTAFRVTSATPVDMFPLTTHCELVMTFDRVQESDIKGGYKSVRPEKSTPETPEASIKEPEPPTSVDDDSKPTSTNQAQEKPESKAPPSLQEQPQPESTEQQPDSMEEHVSEP